MEITNRSVLFFCTLATSFLVVTTLSMEIDIALAYRIIRTVRVSL